MAYADTVELITEMAVKKVSFLQKNPIGYLVASMLAGAYVGIGIILIFAVGAPFAAEHSPWVKTIMGASFGLALLLVIFAGAELFTGNNLVLMLGWLWRVNSMRQLLAIWGLSWVGNLLGSMLLAVIVYYSGVLNDPMGLALVQQVAAKKMHLPIIEMITRGILCNWLVCLAVWCAYRMQSEIGKLVMIFWCLYAFIAIGFEHSVANMTLLTLSLLQPHDISMTWGAMGQNLAWVSLGNIIGGALFVGGAYAVTCIHQRTDTQDRTPVDTTPARQSS